MSPARLRNPDEAVAAWHDALAAGDMAVDSAAWLDDQTRRRGLIFGERSLCTALRPRFLTRGQWTLLQRRGDQLMAALNRAFEVAASRPEVLAQFRPEPWELELLQADPSRGPAHPLGRLDAFFDETGGTFQLTEFNGETPAGAGYVDELSEMFLTMPVMRAFQRHWRLEPLPARPGVLHALLDAAARHGRTGRPSIAIVDWDDVPTQNEFRIFQRWFESFGLPTLIVDPRGLDYQRGRLVAAGRAIDLVYKRVLITELIQRCGMDTPLVRAVRDGAVVMANSFRSKLLHKKASLAVLSDERNARFFTAGMRKVIAAHVPWTRVVEARTTEHDGREVDLLPFLEANREQMVLKPNDDYGGAGIVLGWEVDDTTWRAALRHAVGHPYVAQERIPLPVVPFPAVVDGSLVLVDRVVDTAPFVSAGTVVDGCLCRISSDSLVNVTAGGGSTVATFVVEARGR